MPENKAFTQSTDSIDLDGLARVILNNMDGLQDEQEEVVDTVGLLNALNYDIDEQKKKDKSRVPTQYNPSTNPVVDHLVALQDVGKWISNTVTRIFTGVETGVSNAPEFMQILHEKGKQDVLNTPYLTPYGTAPFVMPVRNEDFYKIAPEKKAEIKASSDAKIHELATIIANDTESVRNRYRDAGLMDYGTGFWDSQFESFGQNLPYLALGGGAAKLGLTGTQMLIKAVSIPMFTIMEASSHLGDMYATTAKKDKDGKVIQGTGDVEVAKRSILFGTLAGTLEFWGVSQAVDVIGKLARNELKDLGFTTFLKLLGKVSLSEGGEEVSQDFIEQTNKIAEGLQDTYSLQELWDSFVGGAVGGAMLGGVSLSTGVKQLKALKEHAEHVLKNVDNLEKGGHIKKKTADLYKKVANDVISADIEELSDAIDNLNRVNKNVDQIANVALSKYAATQTPAYIGRTARAIKEAQSFTEEKPPLKGTKAGEEADIIAQNRKLVDSAKAIEEVDSQVSNPNVLDYSIRMGLNQRQTFLHGLNIQEPDKDYIAGDKQATILDGLDSKALHEITKDVQVSLNKELTDRGLFRVLNFIPKEETQLRYDVAAGIALKFDTAAWNFVRHRHRHLDRKTVDSVIDQARRLQNSKQAFEAGNTRGKSIEKVQTIETVQKAANNIFAKGIQENIGGARRQLSTIIGASVEPIDLDLSSAAIKSGDIKITEAGYGADIEPHIPNLEDILGSSPEPLLEQDATVKMKAVALKLPNGEIVVGQPGDYHFELGYELSKQYPVQFMLEVVDGFVDEDGKFYTRAEAAQALKLKTKVAESIDIGVGKKMTLRETDADNVARTFLHIYLGAALKEFKSQYNSPEMSEIGKEILRPLITGQGITDFFIKNLDTEVRSSLEESKTTLINELKNWHYDPGIMSELVDESVFNSLEQWQQKENLTDIELLNRLLSILKRENSTQSVPKPGLRLPRYEGILEGYKGSTFKDMYLFLEEVTEIDPETKEALDGFLELIQDRPMTVSDLDAGTRGTTTYYPASGEVMSTINKNAYLRSPQDVWNTFVHEASHNYLTVFVNSNSEAAKRFKGKVGQVINTVKYVLETKDYNDPLFKELWKGSEAELIQFKKDAARYIQIAIMNPNQKDRIDEFLASIISNTQSIKWLTDRIKVGERTTLWMKIKRIFGNAFAQHGISVTATRRIFEILEEESEHINAMNRRLNAGLRPGTFNEKAAREHNILSKNITDSKDRTKQPDDMEDTLDNGQVDDPDDDESITERRNVEQFTALMADINGLDPGAYRDNVRELSENLGPDGFAMHLAEIDRINKENNNLLDRKLRKLFTSGGYKANFDDFESFKRNFLLRQYLNITKKSAKDGVIFVGSRTVNPETGIPEYSYQLRRVKGEYVDGSGRRYNTYKYNILLEEYLPKLEVVLGLPKNTFSLTYIEGFEDVFNGEVTAKSNLTRLTPYTLGAPGYEGNKTGLLAERLWNAETRGAIAKVEGQDIEHSQETDGNENISYLYVGNFGGKNTIPILAFPSRLKNKIRVALQSYEPQYLGQVIEAFRDEVGAEENEARRMSAITSALLEDMWYGAQFDAQEDGIKVQSKIAAEDMNKIQKRRRKWLAADTGVYFNPEDFESRFGSRHFSGMQIVDNDIVTNAFVFNSADEGSVIFKYRGKDITISLREMLINELGTPTTDGATFYIIGEFDEVYSHLHGALKSGAIKNLYSSRPGENPLYIKHAMHGVHKNSMLGQFMIQNNLALLISDEAAKIGGKEIKGNMSEHYGKLKIGSDQILKLKMSQWERIKEEQNNNPMSGNMKQFLGGISFSDVFNPIVKEAADKVGVNVNRILLRNIEKAHITAQLWFKAHNTRESWMELLQEVISQPQSPQEEDVASIWADRLLPKEGQSTEEILQRYQEAFNHPQTAEVLRNRMQQVLKSFLEGKIAGARVAIGPNLGYANAPADVDPVLNRYNQSFFLVNYKHTDPEVLKEALPEQGLIDHIKDLIELQRREQRAHTFLSKSDLERELDAIKETREKVYTKIREIKSERLNAIFAQGNTPSVYHLINWTNPKVSAWSNKMVEEVLEPNGQLKTKFALLPEDVANVHGIKPGDRFIPIVTPLSGSVDLGAVTCAGIIPVTRDGKGRKVADSHSARFSSKWIQSILGKDFDIDTVSIIPFNPDFWDPKDYEDLCNVLEVVMDIYPQRTAEAVKNIFEKHKAVALDESGNPIPINKDTIFTHESIRIKLGQIMNGVPRVKHRTVFPILGSSFFDIDSAYLSNTTANIVSIRRLHGIFSNMNLRAHNVSIPLMLKNGAVVLQDTTGKPLTVNMEVLHPGWLDTHVTHALQTHDAVDFPNKTNKLLYNSDPYSKEYRVRTLEQIWGLNTDKVFQAILKQWQPTKDQTGAYTQFDLLAKGLNAFHRLLFGDAIQLTAGRNPQDFSNLDYYETREQLKRAKFKLNLLDKHDKEGLKKLWADYAQAEAIQLRKQYGVKSPKFQEGLLRIRQQTHFINSYIDNMEYDDVYSYPPFKAIELMDPDIIPIPGNTFHEHLAINTIATRNLIGMFPAIQRAYENLVRHAEQGSIFKIPEDVAARTAREIVNMYQRFEDGNPLKTVRWLLSPAGEARRTAILNRMNASSRVRLAELFLQFQELDKRAGTPYDPIVFKNKPIHVDQENIIFSLLPREMDFLHGRGKYEVEKFSETGMPMNEVPVERQRNSDAYWQRQLRLLRNEVNTIIQAFGEYVSYKPTKTEQSESVFLHRKAHETTYPVLFKALFDNRFLFFGDSIGKEFQLIHKPSKEAKGIPVIIIPMGTNELVIKYKGIKWTHNSLREAVEKNNPEALELYKLFTERNGLWEGIGDNAVGSYNRYTISQAIQLGRNIPMEVRQQLAQEWLDKRLYNPDSVFTNEDKVAFWLSLLSQPSEQGARDNKATGFILSKVRYNPDNPLKFHANSIVSVLMNKYEKALYDTYLAYYNDNTVVNEGIEIDIGPLDFGSGSITLAETDASINPHSNTGRVMRTFLSQYVNQIERMSTDESFLTFYRKMLRTNWQSGLKDLRQLAQKISLIQALSENKIYYQDLVIDLKTLDDSQFQEKYGKISLEEITTTIERYMGSEVVGEFLKQHVGESNLAFRTRGNVVALYWSLNGMLKRASKGNQKLSTWRKLSRLALGYDLVALLEEKQVFGLMPKDEIIGFAYDMEYGTRNMTVSDVQIALRPFATRTYMPMGNSSLALAKSAQTNRALTSYQVRLNTHIEDAEEIVSLLTSGIARWKWRRKYAHSLKSSVVPDKLRYISALLDHVKGDDDIQMEIRRKQVFEMAEFLAKRYKIIVGERKDGTIFYRLTAGKGYTFNRIEDLIQTHYKNMSAVDKIALVAAIELRVMYDVLIPKYIKSHISYLERSRDELQASGLFDRAIEVNNMVAKYRDMLEAIAVLRGNYLPHQFPIARYKEMWSQEYIKAMIHKQKLEVKKHQELKKANKPYNPAIVNKTDSEIKAEAELLTLKAWGKMTIGWNKGTIIPNFLPRKLPNEKGYTKTDPTTHINYVSKLIEGMRNDALLTDWYAYLGKAIETGERYHVIELTKNWYADQINNVELHSETIDVSKIKKGQQISFSVKTMIVRPGFATGATANAIVSGVVKKVTKDEIHLDVDHDQLSYKIKTDLERYQRRLAAAMSRSDFNMPSQRDWIVLQNMINQGYVIPADYAQSGDPTNWRTLDVLDLIVRGLERVAVDPSRIGIYKKKDLWCYNSVGKPVNNKVNRYVHSGAVERVKARARELYNIKVIDGRWDDVIEQGQYYALKATGASLSTAINAVKKTAGLVYMGLASAAKARFNNQMGAAINNIIDAPIHNTRLWLEARDTWKRIKHGNLDLMMAGDRELYQTLVGLGLTEGTGIMSIALEAANIKPEDMLIRQSAWKATKWLTKAWIDAIKYKPYAEKFDKLKQQFALETDPLKRLAINAQIEALQKEWEGKLNRILAKEKSNFTDKELEDAWKKVQALAAEDRKINLSQEQGLSMAMASKLIARVAMQKLYTSNLGMGFQAKAEKLRIPAFLIGYYTAIEAGFDPTTEAIQLGVNSVELRHAFYGSANKQFGANTEAGRLGFQFAQYQYNAAAKAIRIISEAIPQLLKFAHSRPKELSRLKHLYGMTKLLHESISNQGEALKRGQVTMREINLGHVILTKSIITAVQIQIGMRIIYGLSNFADPVGQALFKFIEFLIDLVQKGIDLGGDEDKNKLLFMINDLFLVYGLGYKLMLQYLMKGDETVSEAFYKGRADDTIDFLERVTNDVQQIAYDIGLKNQPLPKNARSFFDDKYLIDDFLTGLKLQGWVPADGKSHKYIKEGYFPGLSTKFPFIFVYDRRVVKSMGGGRYVETGGRGIGGILNRSNRSTWRLSYMADPLTYTPYLDKFIQEKR